MQQFFPGNNHWVQPGYSVIGTCSICGGAVTVPTVWAGVVPPVPSCTACGATKKQSYGPVIEMDPARPRPLQDIKFGYSTTEKFRDHNLSNSIFPPGGHD